MNDENRLYLLRIARESIWEALTGEPSATSRLIEQNPPHELQGAEGAFVTLKRKGISPGGEGALRGCIGNILGQKPLFRLVHRLARESAFHDPRFHAVRLEELAHLTIEISVLTIPKPIGSPNDIVVGTDGVLLTCGHHRAVFLPQVATEQGWDRDTMLNHLAMKAGMYPTAWQQSDCLFEVFQAEVFEEEV